MAASDDLLDQAAQIRADAQPTTGSSASDSLLDSMAQEQRRRSTAVLDIALKVAPDQAAQAKQLSRTFGLDPETVEQNKDELSRLARIKEAQQLMQSSPFLARQMSDPEFAKLAHDDMENLGVVEQTLGFLKNSGKALISAVPQFNASAWGLAQAAAETFVQPITRPLAGTVLPEDIGGRMADTFRQYRTEQKGVATRLMPKSDGDIGAGYYSGLQSLGVNLLNLPAAVLTGNPALAVGGMTAATGGDAYGQARDKGVSVPGSLAFGSSQAVVEYATEKLPMSRLLGDLKAGTPFLKTLMTQAALEVPGEQVATVLQDMNEWAVLNPEKPFSAYLADRPSAAAQTLVATIVGTGGQTTIVKGIDTAVKRAAGREQAAQRAEQDMQALTALNDLAASSKLRARDPASFQQFVAQAMEDGPVSDVYINAATLAQSGVDVAAVAQASPAVAAQLQEAIVAGGDIRIPVDEFAATIAGTEFAQSLLPHLKTDPAGMTQVEAQTYMQNQAGELQAEVEKTLTAKESDDAFKASRDAVVEKLVGELNTAGRFTPEVNKGYASLVGNFYAVMGAKLGISPEEMAARYPLQVRAEQVGGKRSLDQDTPIKPQSYEARETLPAGALVSPIVEVPQVGKVPLTAELASKYNQGLPGKRGSITLGDDITQTPSIITLLEKADLSTFLHESGHFFLEVMSDMASRANAPAEVVADMATVLEWFGVPDLATWNSYDIEQKREHHEKFARGFEAYLFEGKSPAAELDGLFQRFRAWLLNVYRSLTALNVELTDEVRGVFDRMLASTEAIQEAEAVRSYTGLFETKPGFMTDDEWAKYRDDTLAAPLEAAHALESRSLRDMRWLRNARSKLLSKMQRDARGKRAEVRAEVEAEVAEMPGFKARDFLRENPGAKTPAELDTVAELFGFASGEAMKKVIGSLGSKKDYIEDVTDQRMLERYGDLTDQQSIERAIDVELHNEARLRAVATELNALNKAVGNRAILARAAKQFAEATVARQPVGKLRPNRYSTTAARAARAAETALKAGDLQTAAREKQNQLVNSYAAKAAYEAQAEIRKTAERFRKMSTGNTEDVAKSRDMDIVQAARAILAEYGIGQKGKRAQEYLKAVESYDPSMYAFLRDRVDAATLEAKPFHELTVDEMRALRDEVDSLWYLAKRSRQMEVDGDLLDREEVQLELKARIDDIGVPDRVPGEGRAITEAETRLSMMQSFRAAARRVESWVGAKDGNAAMGPFRKYVWNPVKEAADHYRSDKAKYLKRYRELLDAIAPSLKPGKIDAPELGYTFGFDKGGMGKVELLHAILHTGNDGNKKKLLVGRKWATEDAEGGVDTSKWDAFVQRMIDEGRLTKADFDFAQGVWDLLEEMKPMAQKAHRDVFGRYFDEVTAHAFATPFGAYRGGYVPAIADSRIVSDAKTRALAEEENSSLAFAFPTTNRGFTKGRVDYNKPLLLDLRSLAQHIDKVLLFSHLEQPIRDVRRVLTSNTVAHGLHRIDPAAFDGMLTPWLNRTARQQVETPVPGSNGLMRFFSAARSRAGMAAMFGNVSNTVQQITGLSIAALKVPPRHLLAATGDYIKHPRKMAETVAAMSPYMATRMENEVAQMSDAINDILLNPSVYESGKAWAARHTYFLQSAVDNAISPVVWLGAYNDAMESAPVGMTDEQLQTHARRLADSAVRETQGSTLPEDVSRIETGNAFVRLFTQFAGYFNMQANILGTEFAKLAQDIGVRKGAGRGLYILLFGFLAPAWVAEAIAQAFRGGPDDEDKDGEWLDDWLGAVFGWGTLRSATALVPVAGQAVNAVVNATNSKPYDDRVATSPAISMIESAARAPMSVYKAIVEEGKPSKAVRDVATLITLTTGIPAAPLARPGGYLADAATGRVEPTDAIDAVRGTITGTASPESRR